MFPRTAALGFVLVMSACAGANRNTPVKLESPTGSPGLFVGHSQHGEVVVAATHYRAMIGLATTDVDLGLTPRKYGSGEMLCKREMLTGTHVPRWICRYQEDLDTDRDRLHTELAVPRLSMDRGVVAPAITVRAGSGTRMALP